MIRFQNSLCKYCYVTMTLKVLICLDCKKYPETIQSRKELKYSELIEFVERINKRDGMVSAEELFSELITIHQKFCTQQKVYENDPPKIQLGKMWNDLKSAYELIKNKTIENEHKNLQKL